MKYATRDIIKGWLAQASARVWAEGEDEAREIVLSGLETPTYTHDMGKALIWKYVDSDLVRLGVELQLEDGRA